MKYLLDTNICIFYMQGKFDLINKFKLKENDEYYISEITLAELLYGVANSKKITLNNSNLNKFLNKTEILPIRNSLILFANEKARLRSLGLIIDNFDLLIGTSAVQNEMILVTNNLKHFNRISNIKIEDWTL